MATVNGTISLSYISLWELWNLYVPNLWLYIVLALAAVSALSFYRHRRKFSMMDI